MAKHKPLKRALSFLRQSRQRITYLFVVACFLAATVIPASAYAGSVRAGTVANLPAASDFSAIQAVAEANPASIDETSAACTLEALAVGAELPVGEQIVLPAEASAPITLPKALVDRAVFYANWRGHFADSEAVEALILTLFQMAGAPASALTQLEAAFDVRVPPAELNDFVRFPIDEIVYQYLDAALAIPALVPFVPYVWQAINADTPVDEIAMDTSLLVAQSEQRFDLGARLLSHAQDYMIAAHVCAGANAPFATAFNARFGGTLKVEIRADAKVTIQNNPDMKLPPPLVDSIQGNGTASISLDDLKLLGNGALDGLGESFTKLLASAKEIDLGQSKIVDWFKDLLGIKTAKDLAKERSEAEGKKLKEYEEAIGALTTIFTQLDPALAKTFKTVTSSYLEVVKSVHKWLAATAGEGSLSKIFSLSTVIMTGNIVGAVMNIVSIFGPGKPTPEQQILEQIGKLRLQVSQLRTEMHQRFDRIDAQLNQIYTTMNERFDQIDITLGKINGNIRDVQRSLIELDMRLSQVERNNFELLNVLGRRPLLDAVNAGLDYKRVTGADMPFQPEFVNFERTFHTWGTVHALDPLNTGPSQRAFGDGDLLRELSLYPLDANLNYLNGWLVAHGRAPLANGMLASPRDWLLASRAYTQLGLEWPQHMARIDAAELTELEAVGLRIEQAIANISKQTTTAADANGTEASDSIFSFVTGKYVAKFTTLDDGLRAIEETTVADIRAGNAGFVPFTDASATFDLFAGAEQQVFTAPGSGVQWVPPSFTKVNLFDQEAFVNHQLASPGAISVILSGVPNLVLSELFNSNAPQGRIEMTLAEDSRTNFPCNPPLKPKDCSSQSHVVMTLQLKFGSTVWRTLQWDMGMVVMGRLDTPIDWMRRVWEDPTTPRKVQFDANFVTIAPTPDEQIAITNRFNSVKANLDSRLSDFQQLVYARQIDSMASGPLHPLMVEIAGYKALINAFTILGLPRALASDEFLHAMLFGNQRLFDDGLIISTIAESVSAPITGANLLVNQRPLLKQTALDRTALYIQLVQGYLDAIAAGESPVAAGANVNAAGGEQVIHKESADYLVSARHALDLAVRIARITPADTPGNPTPTPTPPTNPNPTPSPTPPAPGSVQIFLPVVNK